MADVTRTGFGSTPVTLLLGSANEVIAVTVASSPGSLARITKLSLTALQVAGVFSAITYVGVSVVRGSGSIVAIPFRPGGAVPTSIPGLPVAGDIPAGLELLYTGLVRIQNGTGQTDDLRAQGLIAQDGQKLVVICSALIDGSTSAPTVTDNGAISLSTFGETNTLSGYENAQFQIGQNGPAIGRSLPRWALRA